MSIKKARYWKRRKNVTTCELCIFRCKFDNKSIGKCKTRIHLYNELFTTTYAKVSKTEVKLTHEIPITNEENVKWLVAGGLGCNLKCKGCLYKTLTHCNPLTPYISFREMPPKKLIEEAEFNLCQGICFSVNEPTALIEYVLDVFEVASKKGFKTAIFTNGLISTWALNDLIPLCMHFIVDVKGYSKETYKSLTGEWISLEDLEESLKLLNRSSRNLELVTVIIPKLNDSILEIRSVIRWIIYHLGKETIWHLMPFIPAADLYYLHKTPSDKLLRIAKLAQEEGLERVIIH